MNNFGELLSKCWDSKSEEKLFEIKRTPDPDNLLETCRALEGKVPDDKDLEEIKIKKLTEEYEPYTGAAGPSEEQIRKNNLALQKILSDEGIESKAIVTDLGGTFADELHMLQLTPDIYVGYDRWGFIGEHPNPKFHGELDQGSMEDAVAWVKKVTGELEPPVESKVNEQDEPEDLEPSMSPEEPKEAPEDKEMPEPEPSADEEAPEITKEYIGRSEDTHFYMVSTETDEGLVEDLELVDQEGVKKYSAKDNNLDPAEVDNFIIQVIQDVEINEIERSVFMKYILPKILEEEEPEPEEEELEDEEKPEKEEAPEEEEPVESKKVHEHLEDHDVKELENIIDSYLLHDTWGSPKVVLRRNIDGARSAIQGFMRTRKSSKSKAVESKKTLSEMKVIDGENNEFDVLLSDDGTLDTVIDINGREFRFDAEFASLFRDEEGTLSEEGLEELALDALANLEEDEYNELIGAAKEDAAEEYDVSRDDKGKFHVTRGGKTVNGPFDTEEEARDAIRELEEGPVEEEGEAEEVKEQKEIPTGWDVNRNAITKGDKVFADDGRVQGKVEAIWDDGSVDIVYASGPGGPLADTFDIKGHSVTKFSEDVEEKKKPAEVEEGKETSKAKPRVDESYASADIEADIKRGISREEIIGNIRARYSDVGHKQAEEIYNAVKAGKVADWSHREETSEAKMGVDYVKTLKKAVKDATTALKDKDYDAAAKALEDAADDASDGARAAKKMKREEDSKAEEEAKKEKEEEKPKEESVEEEKVEETKLDEKSWWKRILDDLRADSKFASLVKEHGLDSDEVHKYVSQHYFAQAVSKMAIDDVIRSAATDLPGPEDVDEKKKPPVCKKCNTAHWPFQKCGVAKKSKEKSEEGKVPDDKDSEQKKIDKLTEKDGKKKEAIKVEQRKPSLDESKSISCLKNLLNL